MNSTIKSQKTESVPALYAEPATMNVPMLGLTAELEDPGDEIGGSSPECPEETMLHDFLRGAGLAAGVFFPALGTGAAIMLLILPLVHCQLRMGAACTGLYYSLMAIPALLYAARKGQRTLLTVTAFIGILIGILIPLIAR